MDILEKGSGKLGKLYAERNALFIQRHYNPAFPVVSILEDLAQ